MKTKGKLGQKFWGDAIACLLYYFTEKYESKIWGP
jgi:hypothetical protein